MTLDDGQFNTLVSVRDKLSRLSQSKGRFPSGERAVLLHLMDELISSLRRGQIAERRADSLERIPLPGFSDVAYWRERFDSLSKARRDGPLAWDKPQEE
jgi:hypothetical protein